MKVLYRGMLKRVELIFARGDLFDADVGAIVNSENSAFVLASDRNTVSGQLRRRYGDELQEELFEQTGGHVFHAGTVLQTIGRGGYERIFHAGFHDPSDWLNLPGGSAG